jgi:UDP-glucose 4-epimerase
VTKDSRRALVTGGAGFIGSHVVDDLVARGHEVHVLDDLSSGRRENVSAAAHLHVIDLRDAAAVDRLVADVRPQIVSHQAAQASVSISVKQPSLDGAVNVVGGLHLLEACRRHGPADVFVFASTGGAIYGEVPEPEQATVAWPRRPESPYAVHKAAFEELLHCLAPGHARRTVILRYANVYGPRQRGDGEAGVVAIFRDAVRDGRPLSLFARRTAGDDGCLRDYVHVADVVRAHRDVVSGVLDEPFVNVSTGVATSTRALLGILTDLLGMRATVTDGPPRPGDLERSVLAPGPGFKPAIQLEAGLETVITDRL